MSRDTAEVERVHAVSERGEQREAGLPRGSQSDGAGENAHTVAALVERAADLVEPIKPRLRG